MSYTPTNWKTGDVVTSEKLNKLENGVAGAGSVLVVNIVNDNGSAVLDHTWQEIADNKLAILASGANGVIHYLVQIQSSPYGVVFLNLATSTPSVFTAESADDYPVYVSNGGNGDTGGT